MKEDILEQLVDDYLQANGYFTKHNEKFRPLKDDRYVSKKDSGYSDIDVIGIHPYHKGSRRIKVVNCKSWQSGIKLDQWFSKIKEKKGINHNRKEAWKMFRELANQKWADGFISRIKKLTGSYRFTYVIAGTEIIGNQSKWRNDKEFKKNLHGNPIEFLTVKDILDYMHKNTSKTVAPSDVGRLLQVINASKWMKNMNEIEI
jgi:hypothetical protein